MFMAFYNVWFYTPPPERMKSMDVLFSPSALFKLFLLSSDIRSDGSIAIVKKLDFDFFMVFDSIPLPYSNTCFRKKCMCVCVCLSVCLSDRPTPNLQPKPLDRSRSNSISGVLSQISQTFFYFFPYP